ncbi:MAG: hypothetical protein WBN96_02345 [Gammaproteobacteria bacterium]
MLREIRPARQNTRVAIRRWFTDADMDLFIWFSNQVPVKFQLSYGKRQSEHAISWDMEYGFKHNRIDDGEGSTGKYKMSPILLNEVQFDARRVARDFLVACEMMEPTLADFIYARLVEYPGVRQVRPGQDALSANLKSG